MKVTRAGRRITVDVVVDGDGLVGHAGSRDARPVSDKTGLSRALSRELAALQKRAGSHDRGRVIQGLSGMLADGGDCLTVLGAVRDQAVLCHADV